MLVNLIWSMAISGFGPGNTTAVAEFNVYVDAEAYGILLKSGIDQTIIGFDACLGEAAWNSEDMDRLLSSGKRAATFAVKCNASLLAFNKKMGRGATVILLDAVAMSAVLWDDTVIEAPLCYCHCCTLEEEAYGQVIINDGSDLALGIGYGGKQPNCRVVRSFDGPLYKRKLEQALLR